MYLVTNWFTIILIWRIATFFTFTSDLASINWCWVTKFCVLRKKLKAICKMSRKKSTLCMAKMKLFEGRGCFVRFFFPIWVRTCYFFLCVKNSKTIFFFFFFITICTLSIFQVKKVMFALHIHIVVACDDPFISEWALQK